MACFVSIRCFVLFYTLYTLHLHSNLFFVLFCIFFIQYYTFLTTLLIPLITPYYTMPARAQCIYYGANEWDFENDRVTSTGRHRRVNWLCTDCESPWEI